MSLDLCTDHALFRDYICAKKQCVQLLCKQCLKLHNQVFAHSVGVKLSFQSKEFFLRWTEFVLKKVIAFKDIVTQMGYSKIFQMRLQPNHPKGTFSQLNFQDIEKAAIQTLEEHKRLTQGNFFFIQGTQSISEMIHAQFLKDLYNNICENSKFNLGNLVTNLRKKLIESYPGKQIYSFVKFNILPKEIIQIQEERIKLVGQYEEKIVIRFDQKNKNGFPESFSIKKTEQKGFNQFFGQKERSFSSDYHSASQQQFSRSPIRQIENPANLPNLSILSNPSQTQKQIRDLDLTESKITQTPSEIQKQKQSVSQFKNQEEVLSSVSILRSNSIMYQQKILRLEEENKILRGTVAKLAEMQKRVQELQNQNRKYIDSHSQALLEENFTIQLENKLQQPLKKQIQQMRLVQTDLLQENSRLNIALKELEEVSSERCGKISTLEQQIHNLSQNLRIKQKSIQQLNKLISNEEEEIAYRQNQAQILGEEVKKLLRKIQFLEKSIHQLNNLIANQEEEISYRENQVQTLEDEIRKLLRRIKELENSVKSLNSLIANQEQEIAYRENQTEILEKEVKKLLSKINYLQKSIHELNNLINNQQTQIAYRENEAEILQNEVKKLVEKINTLQKNINQLKSLIANKQEEIACRQNESQTLAIQVTTLQGKIQQLQQSLTRLTMQNTDLKKQSSQIQPLNSKQYANIQSQHVLLQKSNLQQRCLSLQNELEVEKQKSQNFSDQIQILKEQYSMIGKELEEKVNQNNCRELQLIALRKNNQLLEVQINAFKAELLDLKAQYNLNSQEITRLNNLLAEATSLNAQQTFDQQLIEQVVLLESQLSDKTHDIKLLINLTQQYVGKLYQKEDKFKQQIVQKLNQLKTINVKVQI